MTPSSCPAVLRGFPGAVLRLSAGGVVLDSNGRLETSLGRELVGRPLLEFLDRESSEPKWERMLAASRPPDVVWELILKDRATLLEPIAFSVIDEPGEDGIWLVEHPRDPRLEAIRSDVTEVNSDLARAQRELSKERARLARALDELELRNRELDQRNRELDRFAYVVSHDLRAPLRAIAGYATGLERDLEGRLEGETREYLQRLRDRVEHLQRLVAGILAYARAGRDGSEPHAVPVAELLAEVVDLLDPPDTVRIEIEPGMPVLETHRPLLEQVFLNLIGNALEHAAGPGARIVVGVREPPEAHGFHEFRVEDDGPGIPERLHERIWTLFFGGERGDAADASGIGLAVVRKLVEGQGGRAWVESAPGEGARFHFLWPRVPPAERRP